MQPSHERYLRFARRWFAMPRLQLYVLLICFQGLLLSSARIMTFSTQDAYSPDATGSGAICMVTGAVILSIPSGFMLWVFYFLYTFVRPSSAKATIYWDKADKAWEALQPLDSVAQPLSHSSRLSAAGAKALASRVAEKLGGSFEWRYSPLFEDYRGDRAGWLALSILLVRQYLCSMFLGFGSRASCEAELAGLVTTTFLHLAFLAVIRPHIDVLTFLFDATTCLGEVLVLTMLFMNYDGLSVPMPVIIAGAVCIILGNLLNQIQARLCFPGGPPFVVRTVWWTLCALAAHDFGSDSCRLGNR
jgi:hypothetical protein